jgi:ribonuclease Z
MKNFINRTFIANGLTLMLILLLSAREGLAANIKVTLLGTGHPFPSMDQFGPSTLIEAGQEKLLIVCGRGVAQRLWLTGWLPPFFGRRTEPFRIWGPPGTKEMMSYLEKAYQWDIRVRSEDEKLPPAGIKVIAEDISEGVVYERNGVKVTAFEVDHGPAVKPALGYRIDYGGRSVVISGDTRFCENLIRFSKGTDVLVHEVAAAKAELLGQSEAARRIIAHHTLPQEAGTVFTCVKPRLAVYSHIVLLTTEPGISAPTIPDLVEQTRKTYSGPLEVGEDQMSIDIGDTIEVRRFAPSSR